MDKNKALGLLWKYKFSLIKTLYINFKTLRFVDAIRLPIVVSKHVKIKNAYKGSIVIQHPPKPFMIRFGFGGSEDLYYYNSTKSVLFFRNGGKIVFKGNSARFSPHFSILVDGSVMEIGDGFTCNNGCSFSSTNGIKFGDNCLIGGNVIVRDSDGHKVIHYDNADLDCKNEIVDIGSHVWICNNCNILKGVTIGNNNIISYNTMCVKSVTEENCIIGGHVGKVIKRSVSWER